MAHDFNPNEPFNVKHWDTYKVLNKIKESIHNKRKLLKETLDGENQRLNKESIEKRIECSTRELSELLRDGSELITNIRVANDRRELKNRSIVANDRYDLVNELRDESKLADEKFANIAELWQVIDDYKDPISLNNGLEQLKLHIRNLLQQKDEMIGRLQAALERASKRYELSQQCKEEDMQCLIERIDAQVEVMKGSYEAHLALLHRSIDDERVGFKQTHQNKWQELHDLREETEQQYLLGGKERMGLHETIANNVQLEHEEECRSTRIQLDRNNEQLQIKLRNITAETMLNTEKLNYNHHMLQKRAEEDIIVRNQQKQRLVRMGSTIADVRNVIDRMRQENEHEIRKKSTDVVKLYENVKNLRQKSASLAESNDQKFQHIWNMYEENCLKQIQEIVGIDKILHEQIMELKWNTPALNIRRKCDLRSLRTVNFTLKDGKVSRCSPKPSFSETERSAEDVTGTIVMKYFIEEICKQTDWFVDDKLSTYLEPYPDVARTRFVQIDNIFEALNIQSIPALEGLRKMFVQSARCVQCSDNEEHTDRLSEIDDGASAVFDHSSSITAIDEIGCRHPNHRRIVDFAQILPTLERYLAESKQLGTDADATVESIDCENKEVLSTLSRLIGSDDVDLFWKSYHPQFSKSKSFLWTALNTGLNKYLSILKKRQKLDAQCVFLRNQNNDLKHMLLQYIPQ